MSLADALSNAEKKPAIIDDALQLIDAEVADKGGISGLAIKAGYGAVKGIRPGFIRQVVTDLLPEFATALEPIHAEATEQNKPVTAHFNANASRVADALLAVTDGKAQKSKNRLVKSTYDKLRSSAKKNVEAAVPRLGKLVEKHT